MNKIWTLVNNNVSGGNEYGAYENSSYYLCNFSVNLKLF